MLLTVLNALAVLAQSAPAPAARPGTLSAAEQQQISQAIDRGTMLYDFDQAAWHTTDALRATISEQRAAEIRGWVVTEEKDGARVTYFGDDQGRHYVIYSALWNGEKALSARLTPPASREPLGAVEQKLAAALVATRPLVEKKPRCSAANYNSVVLPGRSPEEPVSVYFMTPQTARDTYPFGGHYRFDVKDSQVVAERAFAKSCAMMSIPSPRPMALVITHLLDAVPTEIHVFNMMSMNLPVYVRATSQRTFAIAQTNGQAQVRVVDAQQ